MIGGTAYGVVLNDAAERVRLGDALGEPPYGRPPEAPVIYIKPRTCFRVGSAAVPVPPELVEVVVSSTIALLLGRDCGPYDPPMSAVAAACLALDVSEPEADYYRPAIRQRCRDGFLPLGAFAAWTDELGTVELTTAIDGETRHRWPLTRLMRPVEQLIHDLSAFMTLRAGDLLLVGLPGDAPRSRIGETVTVSASGLQTLSTRLEVAA